MQEKSNRWTIFVIVLVSLFSCCAVLAFRTYFRIEFVIQLKIIPKYGSNLNAIHRNLNAADDEREKKSNTNCPSLNLPIDPASQFLNASDTVLVGNGCTVTVDDILYGYDVLFEEKEFWRETTWLGVLNMQDPTDAFMIAELLWYYKPEAVIELGTNNGGGALFYASIIDQYSANAPVITIDPESITKPWACGRTVGCGDPRQHLVWKRHVTFLQGDPLHLFNKTVELLQGRTRIFIIEDSSHYYRIVSRNIELYHTLIPIGGFMLVQDTKLSRMKKKGRWALAAVNGFLRKHKNWISDRSWEKLLYTHHPKGWLKRLS